MECTHTFCDDCWRNYLIEKVRSGPQGINAGCMQAGCNMKVGHSVFEKILGTSPSDKETYWKWLCKSYTDDNSAIKWCPELGCEYCFEREIFASDMEVNCECGISFCFACNESSHKPCDCETAKLWNIKSQAESENVTWIMANTKSCPGCKRPIEKNQGCNHMTC